MSEKYTLDLYKDELETLLYLIDGNYELPEDEDQEFHETNLETIYDMILRKLG